MRTQIRVAVCCLALAGALASPQAAPKEGMFTPDQIPGIAGDLRATGLNLDPAALADLTAFPMGAVISLGGCTASFVSPNGLVVTNHHCARGSVQFNSTSKTAFSPPHSPTSFRPLPDRGSTSPYRWTTLPSR